jgi:hypothetical protein
VTGLIVDFLTRLVFPPSFQPGHFQDSAGIVGIELQIHATVDRRYRAVLVDSFLKDPLVSCLQGARFEYAQIKACPVFCDGELDPVGASDSTGQIGARDARAADLDERGPQPHSIAHAHLIFGDMIEGDVFADRSGLQIHLVLGVPEGVVIGQMHANRGAGTSMIGLGNLVTGESVERDLYWAVDAFTKDGRGPGATLIGDRFRLSGKDCLNDGRFGHALDFRHACWIGRPLKFAQIL